MKILYVSTRPIYPATNGDSVIVYNRLMQLHKQHDISLIFLYSNENELVEMEKVRKLFKNTWCFKRSTLASFASIFMNFFFSRDPIQVLYYRSNKIHKQIDRIIRSNDFDLINVFLIRGLPYVESVSVPVVLDMIDSMQLNFIRRYKNATNYIARAIYGIELKRVVKYENNLPSNVSKTLFVAEEDSTKIMSEKQVVPLGVDTDKFRPSNKRKRNAIIFSGNMSYSPNIQAVNWFLDHCFDEISKRSIHPVEFLIAGSNPTKEVLRRQSNNVIVTGYVDSLSDLIASSALSVAPMQSGSGMQNKILEAMSCSMPVVTTTLGLGNIKARHMDEIVVRDDPGQFVNAVVDIINHPEKYSALSKSARDLVVEKYSWKLHASIVDNVYQEVVKNSRI